MHSSITKNPIFSRSSRKSGTSKPTNLTTPLTREQRAIAASTLNLEKVRALAADVLQAEEQAGHALTLLQQQSTSDPLADDPQQQLTVSLAALQALEIARYQAKKASDRLIRLELTVEFAVNGATRDASSPYLDAALQAVILQEVAPAGQRHAAALADVRARHPALYAQGVTMIERLQARIAQLAQSTGSGPGHAPLTLTASSHSAGLHPVLLLARPVGRELAQLQHSLTETFRSAVAKLEWQATTQDTHPGTYADVLANRTFRRSRPGAFRRLCRGIPTRRWPRSTVPDVARSA